MSLTAPPAMPGQGPPGPALGGGGGAPDPAGQSSQLIQQVQDLLAQIMQNEPEPEIQRAVGALLQGTQTLATALGSDDQQDMTSGLNTPNGPMPDMGAGGPPPSTFKGANKAAMATMKEKGHFNPKGSKGETQQSDKTKNRLRGGAGAKGKY